MAHAKRSQFEVICGGKLFLSRARTKMAFPHQKENGNRVTYGEREKGVKNTF
jgi:hypothetical protein